MSKRLLNKKFILCFVAGISSGLLLITFLGIHGPIVFWIGGVMGIISRIVYEIWKEQDNGR